MADLARLRTVFMGTPLFAVPCLKKLHAVSDVAAVVTQPDRPRGRGQRMTPSPVKAYAIEQGLPVFQPVKVRETAFLETLRKIQPDLIVVVAFGQILPPAILALPKQGCINVHASLLPRYRGAAPMQRCLMAGEKTTGVTTMFMDAGLDTGDMLQKAEIPIGPDMTLAELHDALMVRGADLLGTTLEALMVGTLRRETQDDAMANYAPMITKETGRIDWTKSAVEIHNLVRALDSWPGAYTFLAGKSYKIWRTHLADGTAHTAPGAFEPFTGRGLFVGTGEGRLEIVEIQAPGKKRMKATDYLRGHVLSSGSCFQSELP